MRTGAPRREVQLLLGRARVHVGSSARPSRRRRRDSRFTSASVSRTDRPRATTSRRPARMRPRRSRAPSSARAWPIDSVPAAHVGRAPPRAAAAGAACWRPTIGPSRRVGDLLLRELELVGQAAVAERLLDRVQILALQVLDQRHLEQLRLPGRAATSLTTTGTLSSPACCAARQRRSPAMIW